LFFKSVDPFLVFKQAVDTAQSWLYTYQTAPTNIHAITLVLREMPGVAYTTGNYTNKEIHFSLGYILGSADRAKEEIAGVLTHEMVHCYQYNGQGKAPSGLIEGIADWVRLNADLIPPHWKEGTGDKWNDGYEKTAYFLNWLEGLYGVGTVMKLNEHMKDQEYSETIFKYVTGRPVNELWSSYRKYLDTKPV